MQVISYKFVDGHKEEIEVSDEVAAALANTKKSALNVKHHQDVEKLLFLLTNLFLFG